MVRCAAVSQAVCVAFAGLLLMGASPATDVPAAPQKGPESALAIAPVEAIDIAPVRVVYRETEGAFLKGPRGVFYDRIHDEIYVADTGNDLVTVFDRNGTPVFSFGYNGEFREPIKAIADRKGRIYVLAGIGRKLRVFNYRGEWIEDFRFPKSDEPPVPTALALDGKDNLYVADAANSQILVYGPDRTLRVRIGANGNGNGYLKAPQAIAVDSIGDIYVADARSVPLQVWSRDGRYLRGWGERQAGPMNFSLPSGIAVDGQDRLITVDMLRQTILIFTRDGYFLGRYGGLGSGPGAVAFPTDVASDGNGRLFVVERVGNRLQILEQQRGQRRIVPIAPVIPDRVREEVRRSLNNLLMMRTPQ